MKLGQRVYATHKLERRISILESQETGQPVEMRCWAPVAQKTWPPYVVVGRRTYVDGYVIRPCITNRSGFVAKHRFKVWLLAKDLNLAPVAVLPEHIRDLSRGKYV